MFANAQTGNVVLLGLDAGEQHWRAALVHVPPIVAFLLGVAGLVPVRVPAQVVTAAIAFVAAVQVSTFRSLGGIDYSTTLTTSNLRSLVEKPYRWRADHDATAGRQAVQLAAVLLAFGAGAGAGGWCTRALGPRGGVDSGRGPGHRAGLHRRRDG